jgi:UDP-glucose 4-epimerase
VDDLCSSPNSTGKVTNVGSQAEITILGLAEKVKEITGSSSPIKLIPYDEAYAPGFEDMMRRVPDTSRIESLIGWKPQISLDETLTCVRDELKAS